MDTLDFRSDTVTLPTAPMRRAMADAEVGDDVYGEDPTVRRLEERIAALTGQAAALFVPSGTMGNQLGVGAQVSRGDEVIAEASSHVIHFEGGALSALWGVQPRAVEGERGILTPQQLRSVVRTASDHTPRSRLLSLENTHGRFGSVWPLEAFRAVVATARELGLAVHLDGARLFNAQVASGMAAKEYASLVDSVSVCFSKGLGAPVGSALCGNAVVVAEARKWRKRLGGAMRQAGILAAAALYALDHHVERLREDHDNARRLAEGLAQLPGVQVQPAETNLVFADFGQPAAEIAQRLKTKGILVAGSGFGTNTVRWACHLHHSQEQVDEALARVRAQLG